MCVRCKMPSRTASLFKSLKYNAAMTPLWTALAFPVGSAMHLYWKTLESTCDITVRGAPHHSTPAIYVNWHQHIPHLVSENGRHGRCMLISAAPYMEPIVRWALCSGLRVVRGASGESASSPTASGFGDLVIAVQATPDMTPPSEVTAQARGAVSDTQSTRPTSGAGRGLGRTSRSTSKSPAITLLADVIMTDKVSVILAVDGPAGPAFHAKRGCVDLAQLTGAPIIPMCYRCTKGVPSRARWDWSLVARPFDRIEIRYGQPITINPESPLDEAIREVEQSLVGLYESPMVQ